MGAKIFGVMHKENGVLVLLGAKKCSALCAEKCLLHRCFCLADLLQRLLPGYLLLLVVVIHTSKMSTYVCARCARSLRNRCSFGAVCSVFRLGILTED